MSDEPPKTAGAPRPDENGAGRGRLADDLRHSAEEPAEILEANRRLREAVQRKDDLLALSAHDLRAPLELILAQARLLLGGARGDLSPDQRRSVEAVERQARRIRGVAEDLAGLTSVEGELDLSPEAADLAQLCNEVADVFAPALRERGGVLVRSLPPYPLVVSVDATKIRRVLSTLLSEAILASTPGSLVELALEPVRDGARATLSFEPRPPAERAATGASSVGLAICRELVELHGGVLESTPGRHSVSLPAFPRTGAAPARRGGESGRPRVLVVDDEPDAREALAAVLEGAYQVATARDGEEGVRVARAEPPDLVLMDVVMPRLDGLSALEVLRNDPRTAEIPVILVSARSDDLTKVKALGLGAVDYLQKPFSERELLARMERTLRLTQRHLQLREMAQTDTLTGLANLRAFRARLEEEVKRARRYHTPLTCVMADMDDLKPVNDELGHAAGDRAIAAVADVIREELRETDFGARYGGDEFVVLLPHTTGAEGRIFAERVCSRLQQSALEAAGRRVPLGASFGVAELPGEAGEEVGDMLVRRADEALYAAKRAGRGRVAEWSDAGGG